MDIKWDFAIIKRNLEGFLEISHAGNIAKILADSYEQFALTVLQTGSKDIDEISEGLLSLGELRHIIKLNFKGDPGTNIDRIFKEMIEITQKELTLQAQNVFGVPEIQVDDEIDKPN